MGSAELLVESDVTKAATISNLSNYRYIYIELSNTAQTAVYATNNIPIELFKRGISYISYCNGSFGEYGTVKYISDTTINIIVNASNIICRVYGTK